MKHQGRGKTLNADQRRALTERLAKFKENQQKIRAAVTPPAIPTAQEVTAPEPLEESFDYLDKITDKVETPAGTIRVQKHPLFQQGAEAILFQCVNCQFQESHPSFEAAITAHNSQDSCYTPALVNPTPKYLKQQADKLAKKRNKPRYVHRNIETVVFE